MGKQPFLPVILGSDENAYGMARAFHERYNINSLVLCKQVLPASKYSKIMEIVQVDDLDDEPIFLDNIKRVAEEKSRRYKKLILIPCSDRYIELAAKNRDEIGNYFCNKFIPYELLQRFVTKEKFYETCEEYNLTYPKTVICKKKDRTDILTKLPFGFPVIVKAINSNSYDFLHSSFEIITTT
jgi:D-aspartate ligase